MKKYIEYIKVLWKKPYGKAVFFFGFYLLFFVGVAVLARVGGNGAIRSSDYQRNKISGISADYLKNSNYSFDYKIVLDGVTYNYVGNKEKGIFNYTYDGKEYYNDKNKSFTKLDNKEIDNPIKFDRFFNDEIINRILKASYSESKTTYDSGEVVYNLLISSNTLNKIISEKDTDLEEVPNKIKVSVNEKMYVNEIDYNLDSYCKLNELCKSNLNIIINLKNYSNVN